jgi:pimeloyl-ACP methyl ester carboxylesterase
MLSSTIAILGNIVMARKVLLSIVTLFALGPCALFAKTEFGKLGGAEFRIDVPDNWNHGLVVYYHGYDTQAGGVRFDPKQPLDPRLAVMNKAGFALIQSGYSRAGWAIEQAIPETEALRKYFIAKYGRPSEVYAAGASMGGMLTVMTIEQSPDNYAGGLDLCGAVEDPPTLMTQAFDGRVIFDYYFPGILPDPSKVPADYEITDALNKKLVHLLQGKPQSAAVLRRVLGMKDDKDLADVMSFGTWVLKDIEQRAGGNPFDNRNTIYTGMPGNDKLNDGVKRYAADRDSLFYLQRYYTPTGRLIRPVLALHTTYDPLVSPSIPGKYSLLTRETGAGDLFVVQYVKHDGHCNFTPEEVERAFSELRRWRGPSTRPTPGWLNVPAEPAKKAAHAGH